MLCNIFTYVILCQALILTLEHRRHTGYDLRPCLKPLLLCFRLFDLERVWYIGIIGFTSLVWRRGSFVNFCFWLFSTWLFRTNPHSAK